MKSPASTFSNKAISSELIKRDPSTASTLASNKADNPAISTALIALKSNFPSTTVKFASSTEVMKSGLLIFSIKSALKLFSVKLAM